MKRFHFISGLSISLLSLAVAACSSDSTSNNPGNQTGTDGGGGATNGGSGNGGGGTTNGGSGNGGGGNANGGGGTTNGGSGNGGGGTTNGGSGNGGGGAASTDGGANQDGGGTDGGETYPDGQAPSAACETYCTDSLAKCTGANKTFNNEAACLTACAGYDASGTANASTGNTLQCRQTHLNNIQGAGDAATHCPHTGPTPTAFCVP